MGSPSREAGTQRQEGPRALEGWHLAFLVDAQHQRTVGGLRYRPTISRTFSTNWGSADSLKVSTRCAWRPNVCQIRAIVAFDRPTAAPKVRVLHCVISAAGASNVRVITATTRSSLTVRGRPRPRLVAQPFEATQPKPFAPLTDAVTRRAQPRGDRSVRQTVRTAQHDPRAQRQTLRRLRAARPFLQGSAFGVRQHQRFVVACSLHGRQRTNTIAKVQGFF